MTLISPTDPRITARAFEDVALNATPNFVIARLKEEIFTPDDKVELLVLSVYSDVQQGGWIAKLDKTLGGAVTDAFRQPDFDAHLGQHQLIDVTDRLKAEAKKYLLVVGMGPVTAQASSYNCGLFKFALESAEKLEAQRLLLPFLPDRGKLSSLAVSGTIAVLRCRVGESVVRNRVKSLKEIRLVVSAQAENAALRGLSSRKEAFCVPCPEPSIVTEKSAS